MRSAKSVGRTRNDSGILSSVGATTLFTSIGVGIGLVVMLSAEQVKQRSVQPA